MAERFRGVRGSAVAVVEADAGPDPKEAELEEVHIGGGDVTLDPLYPVALLKVAMALRRLDQHDEVHFEAILDEVLRDMIIDRDEFQGYLARNMGRLVAAAGRANLVSAP